MEQKTYEFTYLLDPELSDQDIEAWQTRISKLIEDLNGQISTHTTANKRPLAYPIKKKQQAVYANVEFSMLPEKAPQLLQGLKHEEAVLRSLLVEKAKPRKKPTRQPKAENEPSPETPPEETTTLKAEEPEEEKEPKRLKVEEIDKHLEELLKNNP